MEGLSTVGHGASNRQCSPNITRPAGHAALAPAAPAVLACSRRLRRPAAAPTRASPHPPLTPNFSDWMIILASMGSTGNSAILRPAINKPNNKPINQSINWLIG